MKVSIGGADGPSALGSSTPLRSAGATPTLDGPRLKRTEGIRRMAQTNNRFFDDIARLMTDAAGAADGVRREVETVVKTQIERLLRDMDIASREEVEVLRDMVVAAREENEQLAIRVKALESQLETRAGAQTGDSQAAQAI
jgi:BMFP domain-containing protein YqiC